MISHSYAVFIICIKIIYYSYDARFLLFLAHIWMRIVGWMFIQSCIVGDMMMMSSYLYDDTYVDWCKYSQLMILSSCRSGWLWCFSHMIEWEFYSKEWVNADIPWWFMQVVGLVAVDRWYGADHSVLLLMFILILFMCLVSVMNAMHIIRCKGHIKTHDVIVCLYIL